jgi:hypothetical protein
MIARKNESAKLRKSVPFQTDSERQSNRCFGNIAQDAGLATIGPAIFWKAARK